MRLLFLLLLLPLPLLCRSILTYDLNRNLPPNSVHCRRCPQPECLYTNKTFEMPSQLTICFRYRPVSILFGQGAYGMVSLSRMDTNMTDVLGGMVWARWRASTWLGIMVNSRLQWSRLGDGAGQGVLGWKHACLSIDWDTGNVFMVENGRVMFNERVRGVAKAYQAMDRQVNTLTVGCYHGYDFLSTRGPVTDFHLYSRNLYNQEMMSFTTCSTSYPVGNIVNWNSTEWVLQTQNNLSEQVLTYFEEDVCAVSNTSTVLIPISSSSPDPCEKLSGHTIGYHTKEELYAVAAQIAKNTDLTDRGICMSKAPGLNNTFKTFLPTSIKKTSWWVWTNTVTRSNITYFPWAQGRPVVKAEIYQCAFLELMIEAVPGHEYGKVLSAEIEDNICDYYKMCTACTVPRPNPTVTLRGLCQNAPFDRTYSYGVDKYGHTFLQGDSSSLMFYNNTLRAWVLWSWTSNDKVAISRASENSLMLGLVKFDFSKVSNDLCGAGVDTPEHVFKLTSCQEDMFTCNDGRCIDLENRCDAKIDCIDESDEDNCNMIFTSKQYKKTIAPFNLDLVGKEKISTDVMISIAVEDILRLDIEESSIKLQFSLMMEWKDHRLEYHNLKQGAAGNTLSEFELRNIWTPSLVFVNTENKDVTNLNSNSHLKVSRFGNFSRSKLEVVEEFNIFKGEENSILWTEDYSKSLKCVFNLEMFPFDKQICNLHMNTRKHSLTSISPVSVLVSSSLNSITEYPYQVSAWKLEYQDINDHSQGVILQFHLKRSFEHQLLDIFLPSMVIIFIIYITNYIPSFYIDSILICTISLLSLTALLLFHSLSLPPTSDMKMSDIWLLAAHGAALAQILLLLRLNCLSLEEDACQRKMATVSHAEFEEGLQRTRVNESYLVPVENIRDPLEKDPFKDTSSRRVEEDKKNLKEKKEYKKKYLNSKLESCQQSLKRYKLAGKFLIPFFMFAFVAYYYRLVAVYYAEEE